MKKTTFASAFSGVAASLLSVALIASPAVAGTPIYAGAPKTITTHLNIVQAPSSAITMQGSSFDVPLIDPVLLQYQGLSSANASSLSQGNYNSSNASGSHGGRQYLFGQKTPAVNLAFSDVPLNYASQDTTSPQSVGDYLQLPVVLGGVDIITDLNAKTGPYTIPGTSYTDATAGSVCNTRLNTAGVLHLTGTQLAELFDQNSSAGATESADLYRISRWDNAGLEANNAGLKVTFPAAGRNRSFNCLSDLTTETVGVVSRAAGSGTTFILRDYLNQVDSALFPFATSDNFDGAVSSSAGNSSALVDAMGDGDIGYVEQQYATTATGVTLQIPAIRNAAGTYHVASNGTVTAAANNGLAAINVNAACPDGFSPAGPTTWHDTAAGGQTTCFSIANAPGSGSYAISGFSYAIYKADQSDEATAVALAKFLLYTSEDKNGQSLAAGHGFVPLPANIQNYDYQQILNNATYGGSSKVITQTGTGPSAVYAFASGY